MMKEFLKYIKKNDEFVFNETNQDDVAFIYDFLNKGLETNSKSLSYEHPKHGSYDIKILLDEPYKVSKLNDMTPRILYNVQLSFHGTYILQRCFLFEGSYIYRTSEFIPERVSFQRVDDILFIELRDLSSDEYDTVYGAVL